MRRKTNASLTVAVMFTIPKVVLKSVVDSLKRISKYLEDFFTQFGMIS